MKLTEIQQQAVQARMNMILGAEEYDRLFLDVIFSEVIGGVLYAFAQSETLAAEIEDKYALHLSIVVGQIAGTPVEFVQFLSAELHQHHG
jgi:hypothetical protein